MTSRAPILFALFSLGLSVGCSGDDDDNPMTPDAGTNTDAGPRRDGGEVVVGCDNPTLTPPGNGTCTHTAGTSGAVLFRGDVVAPDSLLENAMLLVGADGTVKCAACDCSAEAEFSGAAVVECAQGLISPALINAHDHLDFSEGSGVPHGEERFEHRHDWREGQNMHTELNTPRRSDAEAESYAELRTVFGGAVSINGAGGQDGLLRNLDRSQQEGLNQPEVQYSTFPLGDIRGERQTSGCNYPDLDTPEDNPIRNGIAYAPHIAEGIDISARNEYLCLSRMENGGQDVIFDKTAIIHGVGLTASDYAEIGAEGASLIWSPRTNIDLYGHTAPVVLARNSGVQIALGTDWPASGSMNMLRELKCATEFNERNLGGFFSDREIFDMATRNAADVFKSSGKIGYLAPGRFADVTIFDASQNPSLRSAIEGDPSDVVLVMRAGLPLYGDDALVSALTDVSQCETVDVCGTMKRACAERETGNTIAQLRATVNPATIELFECGDPSGEPSCLPFRSMEFDGLSTPDDSDGDGIPNDRDNCATVFNAPRDDLDADMQPDTDNDMVGDACDVCPLDAMTTDCTPPDPNDRDKDGLPNAMDNCPDVANMDQADRDMDMIGDVCDACPDESNLGGAACSSTIYEIKQGNVTDGRVRLANVIVTGVSDVGYFIQTIEGDPDFDATLRERFSGLFVFAGSGGMKPARGDRVTLDGDVGAFFGQAQLQDTEFTVLSSMQPLPAPILVTPAEVATGGTRAAELEGVLVEVRAVTVTELEPPAGPGDTAPTNEFVVDGELRINDYFYLLDPLPQVGEQIQFIIGVLRLANENSKLEPRDLTDYGVPPALLGFNPPLKYVRGGSTGVPAGGYALELTRPALAPIAVTLTASAGVTVPGSVMFDTDDVSVDITVDAPQPIAGPLSITASYDDGTVVQRVTGTIRVYDDATPREIENVSLTAATVTTDAMTDGSVTTDLPGAVGGTGVTFTVAPSFLASVAPITLPEGVRTGTFVLVTTTSTGTGTLTVSAGGATDSIQFEVIDASSVPVVINELLYDSPGSDAPNVFTEIYGPPGLELTGWSLEGINGSNGQSYRVVSLSGATIPPDGFLVVTEPSANATLMMVSDFSGNVDWQNGPDTLLLKDGGGMTVDALQYGDAMGNNAGEGAPSPDVAPGSSLTRDAAHTDTDDNATDFTEVTTPTPGS